MSPPIEIRASARHSDTVVGTRVVFDATSEDVRNIANTALFVGVILGGALLPAAVVVNVGFPRCVPVPQEPAWDDRNGILAVGDADKMIQSTVDEICKLLVSNLCGGKGGVEVGWGASHKNATHAWHSVSVELNGATRHIDL